jgi:ketosteroid isomerase-like protein
MFKKTVVAVGIVLAALAVGASTASAQQAASTSEAKAVLDKALATFNARDYATYETLFTNDVEVYTGVYTPLRFIGKAHWLAFIRGLDAFASASYEQRQPECRSYNGDTVLCNAYFVFTTVTKNGVSQTQSGRESTTVVKINGKWLIANHHFSALF